MDECCIRFIAASRQKLVETLWPRITTSLQQLSEDQIWWRPNEASNSIGNLLLHLNGNVRQWLLGGIGGKDVARDRDAEFNQRDHITREELIAALGQTIAQTDQLLANVTAEDLAREHKIQAYEVTGFEAIYHVVEHFAMHYGQILYIVKMLQARDLGFYAHLSGGSSKTKSAGTPPAGSSSRVP